MLNPQPGEFFIDGTLGGGGHANFILKAIGDEGKFLGVDLDKNALDEFEKRTFGIKTKIFLVNDNFVNIPRILEGRGLGKADGLLLDLGLSSDELESSGRGFTFLRNESLLMTLADGATPVKTILRELGEKELADIIFKLSDERYSRQIAKSIKDTLRKGSVETTFDLRDAILRAVPKSYEGGRINPATRTFQALRIYANQEFENIKSLLANLKDILRPGSRLAVITFHSGEDRVVKNALRDAAKAGVVTLINKKVIVPQDEETRINPRSRSAKLRAAIFTGIPVDRKVKTILTSSSIIRYS